MRNKKLIFLVLFYLFILSSLNVMYGQVSSAEKYKSGHFEKLNVTTAVSGAHKVIKLKDGRILLMGLGAGTQNLPDIFKRESYVSEIYDPDKNTLVKAHAGSGPNGPLLLRNGQVLLIGANIELYDPVLDKTSILNQSGIQDVNFLSNPVHPEHIVKGIETVFLVGSSGLYAPHSWIKTQFSKQVFLLVINRYQYMSFR